MEGGVDFYCPRGWSYAEDCTFICHSAEAAIWHDGSKNQRQKTVLKNCTFKGDKGFKLGRYHLDAQFYFINCNFDNNMADAAIYKAASSKGVKWGERVYYDNCHRQGGDFTWLRNNLDDAPGSGAQGQTAVGQAFISPVLRGQSNICRIGARRNPKVIFDIPLGSINYGINSGVNITRNQFPVVLCLPGT